MVDWEEAKENFQPLKRGRDAEALLEQQRADSGEIADRRRCVHCIVS